MMIACVVGGSGFMGRRIAAALARANVRTYNLDITPPPEGTETDEAAVWRRTDVTSFEDVMTAFATLQPDIVINLSFMRDNTPRRAFNLNVLGMDNCLEAARLSGCKRIVFSSSIATNGAQASYGERAITETDPPAPRKQYDVHKVFNEWQAHEYRTKHGMSIIGIRVANVGGIEKVIGSVDHVECVVGPALGRTIELDYADKMRCAIHVEEVAEMFAKVALAAAPRHAIYNSGGTAMSLGEIAERVRSFVPDADIRFRHETGGRDNGGAFLFDNSRIIEEFGLTIRPYDEWIGDMIEAARRRFT